MAIVLHHSKAPTPTARLIMLGIANHDGDGGAWPSVATLAKYAGCDPRSVKRCLRELERIGEISTRIMGGGLVEQSPYTRPNRYTITLTCPPECDRSTAHRVPDVAPEPVDNSAPDPVTPVSPGDTSVTPPGDTSVTLTTLITTPIETTNATNVTTAVDNSMPSTPDGECQHCHAPIGDPVEEAIELHLCGTCYADTRTRRAAIIDRLEAARR